MAVQHFKISDTCSAEQRQIFETINRALDVFNISADDFDRIFRLHLIQQCNLVAQTAETSAVICAADSLGITHDRLPQSTIEWHRKAKDLLEEEGIMQVRAKRGVTLNADDVNQKIHQIIALEPSFLTGVVKGIETILGRFQDIDPMRIHPDERQKIYDEYNKMVLGAARSGVSHLNILQECANGKPLLNNEGRYIAWNSVPGFEIETGSFSTYISHALILALRHAAMDVNKETEVQPFLNSICDSAKIMTKVKAPAAITRSTTPHIIKDPKYGSTVTQQDIDTFLAGYEKWDDWVKKGIKDHHITFVIGSDRLNPDTLRKSYDPATGQVELDIETIRDAGSQRDDQSTSMIKALLCIMDKKMPDIDWDKAQKDVEKAAGMGAVPTNSAKLIVLASAHSTQLRVGKTFASAGSLGMMNAYKQFMDAARDEITKTPTPATIPMRIWDNIKLTTPHKATAVLPGGTVIRTAAKVGESMHNLFSSAVVLLPTEVGEFLNREGLTCETSSAETAGIVTGRNKIQLAAASNYDNNPYLLTSELVSTGLVAILHDKVKIDDYWGLVNEFVEALYVNDGIAREATREYCRASAQKDGKRAAIGGMLKCAYKASLDADYKGHPIPKLKALLDQYYKVVAIKNAEAQKELIRSSSLPTKEKILADSLQLLQDPKVLIAANCKNYFQEKEQENFKRLYNAMPERYRDLIADRGVSFLLAKRDETAIANNSPESDKIITLWWALFSDYKLNGGLIAYIDGDTAHTKPFDVATEQRLKYNSLLLAIGNDAVNSLPWREAYEESRKLFLKTNPDSQEISKFDSRHNPVDANGRLELLQQVDVDDRRIGKPVADYVKRTHPVGIKLLQDFLIIADQEAAKEQERKKEKLLAQYAPTETEFKINTDALSAPQQKFIQSINEAIKILHVTPREFEEAFNNRMGEELNALTIMAKLALTLKSSRQVNIDNKYLKKRGIDASKTLIPFEEDKIPILRDYQAWLGHDLATGEVDFALVSAAQSRSLKGMLMLNDPTKLRSDNAATDLVVDIVKILNEQGHNIIPSILRAKDLYPNLSEKIANIQTRSESDKGIIRLLASGAIDFNQLNYKTPDQNYYGCTLHSPYISTLLFKILKLTVHDLADAKEKELPAPDPHFKENVFRPFKDGWDIEAICKPKAVYDAEQAEIKSRKAEADAKPHYRECPRGLTPLLGGIYAAVNVKDAELAASLDTLLAPEIVNALTMQLAGKPKIKEELTKIPGQMERAKQEAERILAMTEENTPDKKTLEKYKPLQAALRAQKTLYLTALSQYADEQEKKEKDEAEKPKPYDCSPVDAPYIGKIAQVLDMKDQALKATAGILFSDNMLDLVHAHAENISSGNMAAEKARNRAIEKYRPNGLPKVKTEVLRILGMNAENTAAEDWARYAPVQAALMQSPAYLALLADCYRPVESRYLIDSMERNLNELATGEWTPPELSLFTDGYARELLQQHVIPSGFILPPPPSVETAPVPKDPGKNQDTPPPLTYDQLREKRHEEAEYKDALRYLTGDLTLHAQEARAAGCTEVDCRLQSTRAGFIITLRFGTKGEVDDSKTKVMQLKKLTPKQSGISLDDALDMLGHIEETLYSDGKDGGFKTLFPVSSGSLSGGNHKASPVTQYALGMEDHVPQQLVQLEAKDIAFAGIPPRTPQPPEDLKGPKIEGQVININNFAALQIRSWKKPKGNNTKFHCEMLLLPLGVQYNENAHTIEHRTAVRRIEEMLKEAKGKLQERPVTKEELVGLIKLQAEFDKETAATDPEFAKNITGVWDKYEMTFVEGFKDSKIIDFPAEGHKQKTRISPCYIREPQTNDEKAEGGESLVLQFKLQAQDLNPVLIDGKEIVNDAWHDLRSRGINLHTTDPVLAQLRARWVMEQVIHMLEHDLIDGVQASGKPVLPKNHRWVLTRTKESNGMVLQGKDDATPKHIDLSQPLLDWHKTHALIDYFVRSFADDVSIQTQNMTHHNGTTRFTLQLMRAHRENNEIINPAVDSGGLAGRPSYRAPDYPIASEGEPFIIKEKGEEKPVNVTLELTAPELSNQERETEIGKLVTLLNDSMKRAAWSEYRPYIASRGTSQIRPMQKFKAVTVRNLFGDIITKCKKDHEDFLREVKEPGQGTSGGEGNGINGIEQIAERVPSRDWASLYRDVGFDQALHDWGNGIRDPLNKRGIRVR